MKGAKRVYGPFTDVFSYAVTLTELTGNSLPWSGLSNIEAAMAVCQGARTTIPKRASAELRVVIERAWVHAAESRPSMQQIVDYLTAKRGRFLFCILLV